MNSMHIALSTLIFWNVSIIMMNLGCDIILRCKTFGTYLMVFLLFFSSFCASHIFLSFMKIEIYDKIFIYSFPSALFETALFLPTFKNNNVQKIIYGLCAVFPIIYFILLAISN